MLDVSEFAFRRKNLPDLFYPPLLYKIQVFWGCYGRLVASVGNQSYIFLLGHL